jgi:hypothetical protein
MCLYTAVFEKTKTVPGYEFSQRHSAEYTKSYESLFDECEKTFELESSLFQRQPCDVKQVKCLSLHATETRARNSCTCQTGLYAEIFPTQLKEFENHLTCKSCLAASAPALVLNVTKPTGCNKQTASQCEINSKPQFFDLQFDIFLRTNSQAIE